MSLSSGTQLGPYEIQELLGAGGMGEVYRATDNRLNRTVAIKILPKHLSGDADALKRFEREAKAISNLSDPHICALFDIGQQEEVHYLIMEYLEGETLAERLKRGHLPMPMVLRNGNEICEALEKAHQKGIVHRDLKPANIMLTKSGLKLLDFGLAKWHGSSSESVLGASELATVEGMPTLTQEGIIAGTVPYMAPEQLEGKQVDHRTDVFAVGAVLYEMATGQRAFQGESKAGLISAILSSEPPPVSKVRSDTFPFFDYVVNRCLAKDPDERWQSARDVAIALNGITETSTYKTVPTGSIFATRKRESIAWFAVILFLILTIWLVWKRSAERPSQSTAGLVKLSILPPERSFVSSLALTPDGGRLVFAALNRSGQSSLWVRSLDTLQNTQLAGTEDAAYPFWSPDGRFIGFFANGKLKTVPASGGAVQILCNAADGRGGTWNHNGTILFALPREGIYRIQATESEPVAEAPANQVGSHRWPHFLPDGQHYLYAVRNLAKAEESGIYLGLLGSREKRRILPGIIGRVEYTTAGYLLFLRQKSLMGHSFDLEKLETRGEPFLLIDGIGFEGSTGYSPFSVANNGMLATSNFDLKSQLIWFDRTGKRLAELGPPGGYAAPNLSTDQRKLLVSRADDATQRYDLWTFDLSTGNSSRFTFDPDVNEAPGVWSANDNQIFFSTNRLGSVNIFQKPSSGMGEEKILIQSHDTKIITDVSRNGHYLLYENIDPKRQADLWILPLEPPGQPKPFLQSEATEKQGQFSPDAKWVAYVSDETGRKEIYVRSFPVTAGGRWQISVEGGEQPRWRNDGKEIYYIGSDRKLMAVPVKLGETFEAYAPISLFETQLPPVPLAGGFLQYAVATGGQRFLINTLEPSPSSITLVLNWTRLLK